MKNNQDRYDFNRMSVSGKPGFENFYHPEDSLYSFNFNGTDGNPILFSQFYQSEKGRDNGIQSVIKNGGIKSRYKIVKAKGHFHIVLKAGNHQEIARSNQIEKKGDVERAVKHLLQNTKHSGEPPRAVNFASQSGKGEKEGKVAISPKPTVEIKEKSPAKINVTVSAKNRKLPATKTSFRLDFYRPSEEEPLAGKIENILTENNEKFQGFDGRVILDFIESELPLNEQDMVETGKHSLKRKAAPSKPRPRINVSFASPAQTKPTALKPTIKVPVKLVNKQERPAQDQKKKQVTPRINVSFR